MLDFLEYPETTYPSCAAARALTGDKNFSNMNIRIGDVSVDRLGFIGLGVMGENMCRHLASKAGLPVIGFDIRQEPLERLATYGVQCAESATDLAARVQTVFLCLASDKQVEQACFGTDGIARPGSSVKLVVDCGTTSVATTRELSARTREQGIIWVDAPIARGRQGARDGTLSFMVGARRDVFDGLVPLLSTMGTDIIYCGDVSSGQIVKILNNKVVLQQVHALAEALAIGRNLGVDGRLLFDAFAKGSADCKALHAQGMNHLLTDSYPPQAFSTEYARKDIGHAIRLAEAAETDAALALATCDLLDRSLEAGYKDDYYPIFIKLLEQPR
ncbi:hypothetical protein C7410_10444 [Paraburkholderia silvatlantica]|uniref:3-hydroxyisobutyrate dehydrogenase n=1 Tax=Paraburkholderia silvatlantica TaxID=321895 RepID=A0A2V4UMJ8_9BURK|nr:NAD(P)-dependent oxidoreductase [Paraburkholderia silvatlantica]PYE25467.1 hypothetical protein C7410_10444 [Paraburkholderia silvatlantica]